MDIEKIIAAMRESVDLMQRDHMDMDFSLGEEGVSLTGNEARALLTEIDYWRARCGKAERFIDETPCDPDIHEDQIAAHNEWQDARNGESNKQAWLYGIPPVETFTCLGGDHGKGIKPCTEWCGEEMCKPVE